MRHGPDCVLQKRRDTLGDKLENTALKNMQARENLQHNLRKAVSSHACSIMKT